MELGVLPWDIMVLAIPRAEPNGGTSPGDKRGWIHILAALLIVPPENCFSG